jgi:hypothetical protein
MVYVRAQYISVLHRVIAREPAGSIRRTQNSRSTHTDAHQVYRTVCILLMHVFIYLFINNIICYEKKKKMIFNIYEI